MIVASRRKLRLLIYVCFALISSTCVYSMFKDSSYINQTESLLYLNPVKRLYDVSYYWKHDGLGYALPEFGLIPLYAFQCSVYMFAKLFIDTWQAIILSELGAYFVSIFLSFVFAQIFFEELINIFLRDSYHKEYSEERCKRKHILLASAILSFMYTVNFHTMSYIFWRYRTWTLFWTILPLMAYLFVKYVYSGKVIYIGITILASMSPLSPGLNVASLPLLIAAFFMLLLMMYLKKYSFSNYIDGKILGSFKLTMLARAFVFIVLFILFRAWVYLPTLFYSFSISAYAEVPQTSSNIELLNFASKYTTIINIFRFAGYYVLYNTYADSYPYKWVQVFASNPILAFMTFIYPLLYGFSLLLLSYEKSKDIRKVMLIPNIFVILLVLIMKGASKPFPEIGYLLLKIHPTFFRHPYDRFVHLFVFCILVSITPLIYKLVTQATYIRKRHSSLCNIISIAVLCLILLSNTIVSYPLLTGELVHHADKINLSKTSYLNITTIVRRYLNYNSSVTLVKVLVIPFSRFNEYSYNISGHVNHINGKSLIYMFLPNGIQVIQFAHSISEGKFFRLLDQIIAAQKFECFVKLLNLLGIEYIVLHKDFTTKYFVNPMLAHIAKKQVSFVEKLYAKGLLIKLYEDNNIVLYKLATQAIVKNVARAIPLVYEYVDINDFCNIISKSSEHTAFAPIELSDIIMYNLTGILKCGVMIHNINNSYVILNVLLKEGKFISPINIQLRGWVQLTYPERVIISSRHWICPKIELNAKNLVWSSSFESIDEFKKKWVVINEKSKNIFKYMLSNVSYDGNYSLYVETSKANVWSYIESEPINVSPGHTYIVITHIKQENANRTHIVILIHDKDNDKWKYYAFVPPGIDGSFDWKEFRYVFTTPSNIDKIKLLLNAGGVQSSLKGKAKVWFDDIKIYDITQYCNPPTLTLSVRVHKADKYVVFLRYLKHPLGGSMKININGKVIYLSSKCNTSYDVWTLIGVQKLNMDLYNVTIESLYGENILKSLVLVPYEEYLSLKINLQKIMFHYLGKSLISTSKEVKPTTSMYINPVLLIVHVESSRPFMLVFTESYDPFWEAWVYKDGVFVKKVRSIPVYGVINGFWINETGNLTIVIRYVPQDWFELGLKISATTFALCMFYLFWDWRRSKGDRWALWLERIVRSIPRYLRSMVMRSSS